MGIRSARRRLGRSLLAIVALADLYTGHAAWAQTQKQVLVLYPTRRDAQIAVVTDRDLPGLLDRGLSEEVDYYSEFIDPSRFSEPAYQAALREFLGTKYQRKQFDLIIAMGNVPLEFIDVNRQVSRSPVVFFSNSPSPASDTERHWSHRRARSPRHPRSRPPAASRPRTRLRRRRRPQQPYARNSGASTVPTTGVAARHRLPLGLPTSELEARVSSLPAHSIVYYLIVERDGNNEYFNPLEYLDRIAAVANAPIYSWVDSTMDHGIVGGSLKSQKSQVKAIAGLALRVLKGERADTIPLVRRDLNVRQIDWRQLRRWGISEARIPPGTEVLFRQPTVFEQYGRYILGAIGLIGLQTALIGGLVIQKRRRRRAEEALRESEQNFRLTADTAPVMIWRSGIDTGCDFFNKPWLDFRGRTMEEETGNGWTEGVHPSDLANYVNTYVTAFDRREAFRVEYRLRRADGEYRWVLDTGVPRHMHDGTFSGYIGSCIDITERKKSEETLRANEAKLRALTRRFRIWPAADHRAGSRAVTNRARDP
jgi:PAS domain S-box-containing protein